MVAFRVWLVGGPMVHATHVKLDRGVGHRVVQSTKSDRSLARLTYHRLVYLLFLFTTVLSLNHAAVLALVSRFTL